MAKAPVNLASILLVIVSSEYIMQLNFILYDNKSLNGVCACYLSFFLFL